MAFAALSPRRRDAAPGDPDPADLGRARNWGVRSAARIAFPESADRGHDAEYAARLDLYVRDMLREHALESAPDDRVRAGWSYSEIATELIGRGVPAQEAVDLLVLAYATPDINPGRNMAALLSERCPGAPLAFGLTDQGAASPFTGLRLIREYARTAGLRRALLLVAEQAALPYRVGSVASAAIPKGHTGVALLLGDASPAPEAAAPLHLGPIVTRVGVREDAIEQAIRALCPDPGSTTVIAGSALAGAADRFAATGSGRVRVAPPGRPLTGLWWEFADELDEQRGSRQSIVLCDYDPLQGCICAVALGCDSSTGHCQVLETTLKGSAPVNAIAAR